jgi:hypothetical protein
LTRLLSHYPHPTPRSQSRKQQHRRPGRRRARCRPQGDADHQLGVRRCLSVCFCVNAHSHVYSLTIPTPPLACSLGGNTIRDQGASALAAILKETQITHMKCAAAPECSLSCQCPLTLATPHLCSLGNNQLCGLDYDGRGIYTAEGITKLCDGLKGSAVTSLECAAAPKCLPFCQRPLTCLLSHYPHPTPRSQYRTQQHQSQGHFRPRCRPQGDEDHRAQVRIRPRVFAFLSAPVDTPALSRSLPCSSLTVWGTTTSEPRAPPRSPPSSRRRRSQTWGAPPPECLLLCQCPLTRLLSHHPHPSLQSPRQHDR